MNTLRRRKKVFLLERLPELPEKLSDDIIEMIQKKERSLFIQRYFLKLDASCQQLLEHFFAGKSMNEIAQKMGYSPGYVRKKKFECKKRLLRMLEDDPLHKEFWNYEG